MIKGPEALTYDFQQALAAAGLGKLRSPIQHEFQPAPHHSHGLRKGKCAVYVFSLSEIAGSNCLAGPNRVLKVGKAGPNSNARFQSQHYDSTRARSTVAGSLLRSRILWPYLGISNLTEGIVGQWIRNNLDRDNFYLDANDEPQLPRLETYIRGILGSVLEGTESRREDDNV
jgi:hypothetical protein